MSYPAYRFTRIDIAQTLYALRGSYCTLSFSPTDLQISGYIDMLNPTDNRPDEHPVLCLRSQPLPNGANVASWRVSPGWADATWASDSTRLPSGTRSLAFISRCSITDAFGYPLQTQVEINIVNPKFNRHSLDDLSLLAF